MTIKVWIKGKERSIVFYLSCSQCGQRCDMSDSIAAWVEASSTLRPTTGNVFILHDACKEAFFQEREDNDDREWHWVELSHYYEPFKVSSYR